MTNEQITADRRPSQDQRQEERFRDTRIALIRLGDEECVGLIEDVSRNGLKVALFLEALPPDSDITIDGSFEDDWITFQGNVRYAVSHAGGWTVGIQCYADHHRMNLMATRYPT